MTRLALEHNAINMAQGFPDFPPAPALIEAAHRALDGRQNQYTVTWGAQPLREVLSMTLHERYGLHYDPVKHITVTCGVTEALVAALLGLVNPGDEVVIIEPFHENYVPAVAFAGGKPIFVSLEPPDYALDLDDLRRAFSDRTCAILVNTPHNPTGRVFSRAELAGLARLCQQFDVVAITDEIYEHILYDGHQHLPLATFDGMAERTVTIGGLGKTFGVTGWRIGYVCAPEPFSTALRTVHDYLTICAPAPFQYASVAALNMPETYYQELREAYARRRARMMEILQACQFTAQPPEGAYYVMSEFGARHQQMDDVTFAHYLTRAVGVSVVPGSSFYATLGKGQDVVRWAFAKRLGTLDEVAARLEVVCG